MSFRIAIRIVFGIAFYILGGWFIWRTLEGQDVLTELARVWGWQGAAAAALLLVARMLTAVTWSRLVICAPHANRRSLLACGIFALSAPGKYVPGKVLSLLARTAGARLLNVSVGRVISASGIEFVLSVAMTALVGALLDVWLVAGWAVATAGFIALMVSAICLAVAARRLHSSPLPWLPRLASAGLLQADKLFIAASLSFLAAVFVAASGALWFTSIPALNPVQVASMTADYLQSTALSVLVLIAPAGIGAREALLYAWLQETADKQVIATVMLTTRLLDLIADIAFTLLGGLVFAWARRAEDDTVSAE